MSVDCFTYGSLMCWDIMRAITGSAHPSEVARLLDYRRHPVRGEDYPGAIAAAGGEVAGILYRGISPTALARLDAFEGEMYRRELVTVILTDGSRVPAHTYLFRPEFAHLLEDHEWDFAHFLAEGKRRFEARYVGFSRV